MSQGSTVFQRIMCVPGEHCLPGEHCVPGEHCLPGSTCVPGEHCLPEEHVCSRVHMWSQKAFVVAVLSFYPVCSRDRTQVIRLGNKPHLSHLTDPELIPLRNQNQV